MRKAVILGMMALAGFGASDGQSAETAGFQVTVYVQDQQVADPVLFSRAKALATGIFAEIGVHLRWEVIGSPRPARGDSKGGHPTRPDREIVIRLAAQTPVGFHPGAPAYALPYAKSGVQITVFYDRVLGPGVVDPKAGVAFLGHVLAHEIAHVLQGLVRHSETGVMKAQWGPGDRQMIDKPLSFTPDDAELIRLAFDRANCETQTATLASLR